MRAYRWLLVFFPASFRREYGAEMRADVARRLEESRGAFETVWIWIDAILDVLRNAVAAHWDLLRQDLRYAARTLARSPGFALTAVTVTAIGVGANTAAFSVADFVLLRPLPFPQPETLIRLCWGPRTGGGWGCNNQLSPANYRDYKNMTSSFQALGAFTGNSVNLVGAVEPQRLNGATVTPDVLPLFGVAPVLGRTFDPAGAGTTDAAAVVLSFGLWQSYFGGDARILGRSVNLNGAPYHVIGVMPAGFYFPSRNVQLWTQLVLSEGDYAARDDNWLEAVGRLKPGITMSQARADLNVVAERLARDYPETNADAGFSFFAMRDNMSPRYRMMLLGLCGATLCILLLTCANLANLLLARAGARERELAVRAALGAGRDRLVRQIVTECVLLALIGGALGIALAAAAVPLLALLVPNTLPVASQPRLDLRVLSLAIAITTLTGLGFGLLPAIRAGARTSLTALREGAGAGGGQKQRLRNVLVGLEVALSVILLISSGLLIRAVWRIQAVDPGFVAERVITLKTVLPRPKYDFTQRRIQFYNRVLNDVRAVPGVQGAAYITGLPIVMYGRLTGIVIPGREVSTGFRDEVASIRFVTPQYFHTMGIPLLRGRDIDAGDILGRTPVAVVSASFARHYWPNEDPIGRTFDSRGGIRTVVGVVGDVKVRGLERESEPQMYGSAAQLPDTGFVNDDPKDMVIRFSGSTGALLTAVRGAVRAADPEQPISDVRTLEDVVSTETATRRAQLNILVALAAIALLLSIVGIYGLLAYTVSQRSREIGVRLVLGAEPGSVARMIVSQGMKLALVGIAPGLIIAYAAARGMRALLFGIGPADPITILGVVALVVGMTLAGSLVPALRAVRLNPMRVLRAE
ncbi:MAG TPA: ABC transporter permease [Gemmatimonadales bacterium]|nr:ABC transporter permease [Gemmatimonadales bacterium]